MKHSSSVDDLEIPMNPDDNSLQIASSDESNQKKWYTRWYMIIIYVVVSIIAIIGTTMGIIIATAEYNQCERSCRMVYCDSNDVSDPQCLLNGNITGRRITKHKCGCRAPGLFEGEVMIDRFIPAADTWTIDQEEVRYCAAPQGSSFGKTYQSQEEAIADNAIILHKGPCGKCSSIADKDNYNRTRFSLTSTSTKAAFYSIFSSKLARKAMESTDLNDECVDCWVENMYNTLIHCFGKCMFGSRKGCAPDGGLTDCLYCDEVHSGMYFRRCAGMTRRRAGIATDICRQPGEIVNNSAI